MSIERGRDQPPTTRRRVGYHDDDIPGRYRTVTVRVTTENARHGIVVTPSILQTFYGQIIRSTTHDQVEVTQDVCVVLTTTTTKHVAGSIFMKVSLAGVHFTRPSVVGGSDGLGGPRFSANFATHNIAVMT